MIIIVISSPVAPVAVNILIVVDIACVLKWFITASYIIYSVTVIRVVDIKRETVV